MGLWEKQTATLTEEVKAALARAHSDAGRQRHTEVTVVHVLSALFATASVETCLAAMSIEPGPAREVIARELADVPRLGC